MSDPAKLWAGRKLHEVKDYVSPSTLAALRSSLPYAYDNEECQKVKIENQGDALSFSVDEAGFMYLYEQDKCGYPNTLAEFVEERFARSGVKVSLTQVVDAIKAWQNG